MVTVNRTRGKGGEKRGEGPSVLIRREPLRKFPESSGFREQGGKIHKRGQWTSKRGSRENDELLPPSLEKHNRKSSQREEKAQRKIGSWKKPHGPHWGQTGGEKEKKKV